MSKVEGNSVFSRDDLELLNRLGFGDDVSKLEKYVESLQDYASSGEPIVSDDIYDTHIKLLSRLKPDSALLNRNWEGFEDDLDNRDILLDKFGMRSIRTIKDLGELNYFVRDVLKSNELRVVATTKLNGHAVRAVYEYGNLVSGSTRGRYKKGRDITRHLKKLLPNYVSDWSSEQYVEVRGELLVSYKNFEKVKHILKTPLSSVTSFIKESASDQEIGLLDILCYKVLKLREFGNGYSSLSDEIMELGRLGFKTPPYSVRTTINPANFYSEMERLVNAFSSKKSSLDYDTDGVVVSLDDNNMFYSLGLDGNTFLGNFALKVGSEYGTKVYQSIIDDIQWVHGKTYITPKAVIEPTKTANGAVVSVVPLYNIGMMEKLRLIPGATIYFTFGGETGVSLCDSLGNKVN